MAVDSSGKEWIAKIEYRRSDSINNQGRNSVYVFASNYDTWLNSEYANTLEVL